MRFARIAPCLLLAVGLIVFFNSLGIPIFKNDPSITSFSIAVISVLTFWHNILMERVGYFNYCLNIFWSLSVEEVFYLAFPLVCLFLKKTRLIILFLVMLIILAPLQRYVYSHDEIAALYGDFSCFDAIAMGCLGAILLSKVKFNFLLRRIIQYTAGVLAMIVYLYNGIIENVVVGILLFAIASIGLLFVAATARDIYAHPKNKTGKAVCWFGKNSYEIYLFHIIILALMKEVCGMQHLGSCEKLLWLIVFISITAVTAGIISKFYSEPLNNYLRSSLLLVRNRSRLSAPSFQ